MFEISKSHPIPAASRAGPYAKYPWATLDIGSSFFIPGKSVAAGRSLVSQRKASGHRYTCRAEDGGVRIWRIA